MQDFQEDTALPAGTWYLWKTGRRQALVACPLCSTVKILEIDDVNEDGTLFEELVCPAVACPFREHIRLLGWKSPGVG